MAITNVKSFLESGGTKTDPTSATQRFRDEAGLSTSSLSSSRGGSSGGGQTDKARRQDQAYYTERARVKEEAIRQAEVKRQEALEQERRRKAVEDARRKQLLDQGTREKLKKSLMDKGLSERQATRKLAVKSQDIGANISKRKTNIEKLQTKKETISIRELSPKTTKLIPKSVQEKKGFFERTKLTKGEKTGNIFVDVLRSSLKTTDVSLKSLGVTKKVERSFPSLTKQRDTNINLPYINKKLDITSALGSTAQQIFLLGGISSTTQQAIKLTQPLIRIVPDKIKVNLVGTSQKLIGGGIRTETGFVIKKAGTIVKGKATGFSSIEPTAVKNIVKVSSKVGGMTFKSPKLSLFKGTVTPKISQKFVSKGQGFSVRGTGASGTLSRTGTITTGKLNVGKDIKTFISGGVQDTSKRGVSALEGGTIVKGIGSARVSGLIFPAKEKAISFIPLTSKKGSVLISPLSIQLPKINLLKSAGLGATKGSIDAFATTVPATVPATMVVSRVPLLTGVLSSTTTTPKTITSTMNIPKTFSALKTSQVPKQTPKLIQSISPITIQKARTKTTPIQKTKLATITIPKLRTKQIIKTVTPPIITTFIPKITTKIIVPSMKRTKVPKAITRRGTFKVSVRRFGKFRPIGFGSTRREAFNIGRTRVAKTLGATFRVEGFGKMPTNIKGFKTKKSKKGLLFIEQPKFRLSTGSELKEIQMFKRKKGSIF